MKTIYRLLAWVFGAMAFLGLGQNFDHLSRAFSASAARPGEFAEALGELTATAFLVLLAVWFARLSKRRDEATGKPIVHR